MLSRTQWITADNDANNGSARVGNDWLVSFVYISVCVRYNCITQSTSDPRLTQIEIRFCNKKIC
jgi:hypothetical protein